MKRLLRIFDWRIGAVVVVSVFVSILLFIVFDAARGRQASLEVAIASTDRAQDSAQRATNRINSLQSELKATRDEITAARSDVAALQAESNTKIDALAKQVTDLGAVPVVTKGETNGSTTKPAVKGTGAGVGTGNSVVRGLGVGNGNELALGRTGGAGADQPSAVRGDVAGNSGTARSPGTQVTTSTTIRKPTTSTTTVKRTTTTLKGKP